MKFSASPRSSSASRVARRDEADERALKLWVVLARAHAAVEEHVARHVALHGLTLAEFAVLEVLYHKGPLLLSEVQRKILVSSGGISFLADRLEAKGLVERRACPGDRRARHVTLTVAGEDLLAGMFAGHVAVIRRALSGLGAAQQREAIALLRELGREAAALTKPDAGSGEEDEGARSTTSQARRTASRRP